MDGDVDTGREESKQPAGVTLVEGGEDALPPPFKTRHVGTIPDGSALSAHREMHAHPWVLMGNTVLITAEFA